jgi:hypothetical protein
MFKIPTLFKRAEKKEATAHEIHAAFRYHGQMLLDAANEIIRPKVAEKLVLLDRATYLRKIGFTNQEEVKLPAMDFSTILNKDGMVGLVLDAAKALPRYVFLSADQVTYLCKKYGLVKHNAISYTGYIPDKNIREIYDFTRISPYPITAIKVKSISWYDEYLTKEYHPKALELIDSKLGIFNRSNIYDVQQDILDYVDPTGALKGRYASVRVRAYEEVTRLEICAPAKDFDPSQVGKPDRDAAYPHDPIVLLPHQQGYFVVSAWGLEAGDPLVVNPLSN